MNKKALLSIVGIFMFSLMFVGVSYAYLVYNKDIADVSLSSGSIDISFTKEENNNSITINQPIADGLGKTLPNYLEFTVNGVADVEAIKYELEIVPKSGNTMNTRYVKLYLTEVENDVEEELCSPLLYDELYDSLANNAKGIYQDLIEGNLDGSSKNYSKTFRLRAWIDESYTNPTLGTFNYELYLYAINVDATNIHRLTFDMGDERTLSKLITLGEKYGSLPTPIKKGYVFNGWNGKNLINLNNWIYSDNIVEITESSIVINKTDNYYGYASYGNYRIGLSNGVAYTISANVDGDYSGRIYGFFGESFYSRYNGTNSFTFNENDDKERFVFFQNNGTNVDLQLNSDRLIIKEIQLEEGSTQTPYEPYYVTSEIEVTEWNTEYRFKAIYEEIEEPTVNLIKSTYYEVPFDNTWTYNNSTVDNGVLTVNDDATSDYLDVNGGFWYIIYDAYTELPVSGKTFGAVKYNGFYYDENKTSVAARNGYVSNGYASSFMLNQWNNNINWQRYVSSMKNFNRYGNDVKYIKLNFDTSDVVNSSPWYKIRNLKLYGENLYNSFFLINVEVEDNVGIEEIKYAKGNQSKEYFKYHGTRVNDNQIRVIDNGVYTVFVKGVRGNSTIQTIEITNIT